MDRLRGMVLRLNMVPSSPRSTPGSTAANTSRQLVEKALLMFASICCLRQSRMHVSLEPAWTQSRGLRAAGALRRPACLRRERGMKGDALLSAASRLLCSRLAFDRSGSLACRLIPVFPGWRMDTCELYCRWRIAKRVPWNFKQILRYEANFLWITTRRKCVYSSRIACISLRNLTVFFLGGGRQTKLPTTLFFRVMTPPKMAERRLTPTTRRFEIEAYKHKRST